MRRFVVVLLAGVLLAGCGGTGSASVAPPASTPANAGSTPTAGATASPSTDVVREPGVIRGHFAVGDASVWLECLGTGSPTVITETGLGSSSGNWIDPQRALSATTRVCRYDRVAIGQSNGPGTKTITAGTRADELHALLEAAEIEGPYVLVGWSFGGMIVRLFAARQPSETAGLVFLDSSHEDQLSDPWFTAQMGEWSDGPSRILDRDATRAELLAATDLGATPTIVLTEGRMNGDFERHWAPLQDALATMSSSSLHLVATKAGHDINFDAPELTLQAIGAVITAARSGGPLPACAGTFDAVGATCLDGTLVERLAAWDALRATVKAHAGSFPDGTYRMQVTGDEVEAATGERQDFGVGVFIWTVAGGHWKVSIRFDDDLQRENHEGVYDAASTTITFLQPDDFRIGGTPGVNKLDWVVDASGAITFEQTDGYPMESSFLAPWIPTEAGSWPSTPSDRPA
ncbi:MAG TPA: alpha/beta hydrolase [Candidatus Limnocylindrales bacterium]|nr:alpha/beta hydrolase [Candidatus Limnocylindrales bacterium]